MTADDIQAFPRPPEPPAPLLRKRRGWGWRAAGVLAFVALAMAACVVTLAALAGGLFEGTHITVNGHEWSGHGLDFGHLLAVTLGLTVAGMVVLTVVPMAVLLAALLAVGGAALGVGLVLLALLLLAALIFSPLWLVLMLLWLALRRKRPTATTMAR